MTHRAAADDAKCALPDAESFRFEGTKRLYGDSRFAALQDAHVVVLGMGGVGSWAVEALARSGIGALTLVDLDFVCVTNVNRQVLAADSTVGDPKAQVMKRRVLDINPECDVRVVNDFVNEGNVEEVLGLGSGKGHDEVEDDEASSSHPSTSEILRKPDFVLDAIDSENDKAAIVAACVHHMVPILVTGGAGGIDNLNDLIIEDLSAATFNRLLQRVRRVLRREYKFPKGAPTFPGAKKSKKKDGKFGVKCVYAPENANKFSEQGTKGRGGIGCDGVGGSAVFVTGALGFKAASHITLTLMENSERNKMKYDESQSGPYTRGWRSRIWPKSRAHGDNGGGGGGGGGGGDGDPGRNHDDNNDNGRGDRHEFENFAKGASLAAGVFIAADGALEDVVGDNVTVHSDAGEASAMVVVNDASDTLLSAAALSIPTHEIFDAHCHWHLGGSVEMCAALAGRLAGAAFTSTEPPDWKACADAARLSQVLHTRPHGYCVALGLHPWWAHKHLLRDEGCVWPGDLRETLLQLPGAIVGEIGLDRVAVPLDETDTPTGEPIDYENQVDCFQTQLNIATEFQRPVAVHCVKAYGDVFDTLRSRSENPPKILMHSFGGTVGYLDSLVKMKKWGDRFYFGFSSVVNLQSPKTKQVIASVPDDKLLIESDLVDPTDAEQSLRVMIAFIASSKGWTVEETCRITRENAERFYEVSSEV